MNLIEVEKIVASLQTNLFRNSNSYAVGALKSHFKGAGIQFKEHQVYAPGDDVRFIDWKLSARTQHVYVKTFEEERNVEVNCIINLSDDFFVGAQGKLKLTIAIELIALLMLLAEKAKDLIKVTLIDDRITQLPSVNGHAGIATLVSVLQRINWLSEKGQVNLEHQWRESVSHKKSLELIKSLIARKKEVVLFDQNSELMHEILKHKMNQYHNFALILLESSLDGNKSKKFNVPVVSRIGAFPQKGMLSFFSKSLSKPEKHLVKLDIENRYLDEFVKAFY